MTTPYDGFLNRGAAKGNVMTNAMWGILTGLILIFIVSLLRYGHSLHQERERRGDASPGDSH
jgi:hypothetical protein